MARRKRKHVPVSMRARGAFSRHGFDAFGIVSHDDQVATTREMRLQATLGAALSHADQVRERAAGFAKEVRPQTTNKTMRIQREHRSFARLVELPKQWPEPQLSEKEAEELTKAVERALWAPQYVNVVLRFDYLADAAWLLADYIERRTGAYPPPLTEPLPTYE